MWLELLADYGLFLLKMVTIFSIIGAGLSLLGAVKEQQGQGHLEISDLGEQFKNAEEKLKSFNQEKEEHSFFEKLKTGFKNLLEKCPCNKKEKDISEECTETTKEEQKTSSTLYVLDFKGDMLASNVNALRKEISAVITGAKENDEVLLRLESPGGVVTGYGLAASQLARLKQHNISLTVAVDNVAASGGYMMACVADKIVAAPFAVLGSIGVVAQVPNIHRLLKKHDVDVDVMTAGEYKRTVTVMGENTEKGKQKFQQELEETHQLFKDFVQTHRPQLDIEQIATGEHWFGKQALGLNLIDEINTSDDLLLKAIKNKKVLRIKYVGKQTLMQKLGNQLEESSLNIFKRIVSQKPQDFIQ